MVNLANRAKMGTDTTGTGTIALAGAVAGYQSFSAAGVSDGDLVRYTIEDGNNWEIGTGTYTASGTLLARNVQESSNAGSPISLSGNAVVFLTASSVDIQSSVEITGGTIDGTVIGGSTPAAGGFTNITVTGTVDGRDVAADGTKLDTFDQGVATTDSPTFVELTAAQYNSTEALPDIKPSLNLDFANTKALDPRITYTRGSTATYYDGKTFAKAEENLLRYSQEFDNAVWLKGTATITANSTTAPNGTTTADTYESLGDASQLSQSATTSASFVYSVFAKYVDTQYIRLRASGPNTSTWFDIQNGTIGTNGYSSAAIEDVGNGWYRCSVVEDTTAATNLQLFLHDTNGSLTEVAGSCYLWGAQLEQRSALTDYTATTTQPITNYVPALQTAASGEPRFDHDPITGESKGFLIEEQRTNLLPYSEQFDNAAWTKTRSSIIANTVVAPDGTLTGDKLVETTDTGAHYLLDTASITSGNVYTASVYLKAAERTVAQFAVSSSPSAFLNVELSSGEVITPVDVDVDSYSVVAVGNGWYRASLTFTASATVSQNFIITLSDGSPPETTFDSYTGDGYSGIYVWGAQLEAGAFPTSYIPTVASQVTRSADAASMTGTNFSSWYRQDEGTVFTNFGSVDNPGGFNRIFAISDGTSSNYIQGFINGAANTVGFEIRSGGVVEVGLTSQTGYTGNFTRISSAYKVDDCSTVANAGSTSTDTSAFIPATNKLQIGAETSTASQLNGHIKKLAYYPKRLSNATLQALTEE